MSVCTLDHTCGLAIHCVSSMFYLLSLAPEIPQNICSNAFRFQGDPIRLF